MHIAADIKKSRLSAGLTQKQLAEIVGKSFSTIQKYELGIATPPLEVIKAIANACDVPFDKFLYIDPNDPDDQKQFSRYIIDGKVVMPGLVDSENIEYCALRDDLLSKFNTLNGEGQEEAVKSVSIIAGNPKYQK